MIGFTECLLCPFTVNTNDTAESVYVDDEMAFEAGINGDGYAHRRCYDNAKHNADERRGTLALNEGM